MWFWDSEHNNLFKIGDSRAKSNTDFRNTEISAIRIAKRIEESSLEWETRMGVEVMDEGLLFYLFIFAFCFKSVDTSNFKLGRNDYDKNNSSNYVNTELTSIPQTTVVHACANT